MSAWQEALWAHARHGQKGGRLRTWCLGRNFRSRSRGGRGICEAEENNSLLACVYHFTWAYWTALLAKCSCVMPVGKPTMFRVRICITACPARLCDTLASILRSNLLLCFCLCKLFAAKLHAKTGIFNTHATVCGALCHSTAWCIVHPLWDLSWDAATHFSRSLKYRKDHATSLNLHQTSAGRWPVWEPRLLDEWECRGSAAHNACPWIPSQQGGPQLVLRHLA